MTLEEQLSEAQEEEEVERDEDEDSLGDELEPDLDPDLEPDPERDHIGTAGPEGMQEAEEVEKTEEELPVVLETESVLKETPQDRRRPKVHPSALAPLPKDYGTRSALSLPVG